MRRSSQSWARPTAVALSVLMVFASSAAVSAADVPAKPGPARLSASVAAKVAAMKPMPRALQAPTAAAPDEPGFLRSTTGKVAVVVMTVGLGYAIYSAVKDNDAVHSPVR